jgi:hypothetical protein
MCETIEEELARLNERVEALEAGPLQITEATLARLDWKPGEVLVFKCSVVLNECTRMQMREYIRQKVGDVEVIILDPDTELTVMAQ